MTSPLLQELRSLTPSALIEFFELDLTKQGGDKYYFCTEVNELGLPVVWKGQEYVKLPIAASGFDRTSTGTLSRPVLQVNNRMGAMGVLAREFGDFLGCKLTRRRTFARFLDAVNFKMGNIQADSNQQLPDEVWYVDRKSVENKSSMEFELASALDMMGVRIPRRQFVQNCCGWEYRSAECGYTGGPVANLNGEPVTDPALDRCGLRLSDCRLRFGKNTLPYGAMPGVGLIA